MEGQPSPEPAPTPRRADRKSGTPRTSIEEIAAEREAKAKKAAQAASRKKFANANERYAASIERHLEDACIERDRLRMELDAVRNDHTETIGELKESHEKRLMDVFARLSWVEPQYEGLLRDHANLLDSNLLNLVLTGFGASLISGAGYAPNAAFKSAILATGVTMFLVGSFQQIRTIRRNSTSRPKPILDAPPLHHRTPTARGQEQE